MLIIYAGRSFEGPFSRTDQLKCQSGVYLVLEYRDNKERLLYVGESKNVGRRVEDNHEYRHRWKEECKGDLRYAALYCNEHDRMIVEKAVREEEDPPCGKE